MAKPRGPYVPRLSKVRTDLDMRRDLRRQLETVFQRWDVWSKPDADSLRITTRGDVRSGSGQEHAGNPKERGQGFRIRRTRKLKFAGKSLQKEE